MQHAGDFASGVQTVDDLARFIEHMAVEVDIHAAHRVVRSGGTRIDVPGAVLELGGEQRAAVFVRFLAVAMGVIVRQRRLEGLHVGAADVFGHFLECFEAAVAGGAVLAHHAQRHAAVGEHSVRIGDHIAAVEHPHACVGLIEDGLADDVAAAAFIDEALTVVVEEHQAFDADLLSIVRAVAGVWVADLQKLNLLHVDQMRARILRHE